MARDIYTRLNEIDDTALRAIAQMRPVLMMIMVALLGMVPAARATGIGSDVKSNSFGDDSTPAPDFKSGAARENIRS